MPQSFHTQEPLVVFGATGMLGSELVYYSVISRFSPHLVLCGSNEDRLKGLKDELEESNIEGVKITTTTSVPEACAYGGYLFFSRSIRAKAQSREEMLADNAPMAVETARAIAPVRNRVKRLVCVSNPSDLIGLVLLVHSGLPADRVMSLSALDTLRLRRALFRRFGDEVCLKDALTLGSHDNSMATFLHTLRVNNQSLDEIGYKDEDYKALHKEVRNSGLRIYKLRGHTAYQSPALVSLQMLLANDDSPFTLPTARYHHSERYPYVFGALPTIIDDSGCKHLPLPFTTDDRDMEGLDRAFQSIAKQRDWLIDQQILPPTESWQDELQHKTELVEIR